MLAEIETRTGKAVADCFDLIAGTSTGGILALGFARDDGYARPRYVRMQTSLSVASDDMDNATNGNVENLKADLIKARTHNP